VDPPLTDFRPFFVCITILICISALITDWIIDKEKKSNWLRVLETRKSPSLTPTTA
jgi:hypothetical protein